jgi:hypothetical protein
MSKRIGILLMLVALTVTSAIPAYAWHGYRGYHGHHGYYGHHRSSVVIVPRIVVPLVPFWAPYSYPAAVVAPPPRVYVQPAPQVYVQPLPPQPYWYYCDDPPGYYPYVPQCPTGWRQVAPPPPQ